MLDRQFAAGSRVIAVATRRGEGRTTLSADDERDLDLAGFLTFVDRPKADAREALDRLAAPRRAGQGHHRRQRPRRPEGLRRHRPRPSTERSPAPSSISSTTRSSRPRCRQTTIFARVTPEQKSRIIKAQRALGSTVGFLGDGVNDAVALHDADVGISVQTATDVAKDAADIVLLDKDLDDPRRRGRRGPANLRQHDQVRPDGDLVELREHVQRRRRVAVSELPADAPDADPAQQPALRRAAR